MVKGGNTGESGACPGAALTLFPAFLVTGGELLSFLLALVFLSLRLRCGVTH